MKLTDGMEILYSTKRAVARWSEHFQKLLNDHGDIDQEALNNIPERIDKTSLDQIPTTDKMARAIARLNNWQGTCPHYTRGSLEHTVWLQR